MQKDLVQFENRSDDWLAKQRKEEAKTSAWDLDEGHRLKVEHERRHRAYEQKMQRMNNKNVQLEATKPAKAFLLVFIIWFMFVFLSIIFSFIF